MINPANVNYFENLHLNTESGIGEAYLFDAKANKSCSSQPCRHCQTHNTQGWQTAISPFNPALITTWMKKQKPFIHTIRTSNKNSRNSKNCTIHICPYLTSFHFFYKQLQPNLDVTPKHKWRFKWLGITGSFVEWYEKFCLRVHLCNFHCCNLALKVFPAHFCHLFSIIQ